MDQFDRHRPQKVLPAGSGRPGSGGGQGKDRPQPFPTGGQEVGRDLVEEAVACHHGLDQQGFEAL